MMLCPQCGSEKTRVVGVVKGMYVERFRKCNSCGYSFSTVEAIKFDEYWKEYAKDICKDVSSKIDKGGKQ